MIDSTDPVASLLKAAELSRRAIEPGLLAPEPGRSAAQGACLYASILVASTLNRFGIARARVRGGDGAVQLGARDSRGQWNGHYWVEAEIEGHGHFVVDITADQFGHEPVVILPVSQASQNYRPGPQGEVDAAAAVIATNLHCVDLIGLSA
ncbi:hypothetical protein [Paucibacter soli]|uniref:hypothetical protein n=1 Tax=Paucibacter soli TaxID=3133433 RepID=UPI003098ACA4